MSQQKMTLSNDADVVAAWKQALALSRRVGFSLFKQACLSGAVLELCRHAVEHAGKATFELADASDGAFIRARVVVDGCSPELMGSRGKPSREINVGPALPAVKLHQVVETLEAAPGTAGARVTLTIHQSRAAKRPLARHPLAAAADRRR